MPNYRKLYTTLFNAITDALEDMGKQNYGLASERLMHAQQIDKLLNFLADACGETAPPAIILDHAGIVIHVLHVYDIVLYAYQVPLGEVVEKQVRSARRQVVRCSPPVAKLDVIKSNINHKHIVSVQEVRALVVDLVARHKESNVSPLPHDVVTRLTITLRQRLLHFPHAITKCLADKGQVVFAPFRLARPALEAHVEGGRVG